MREQSAIISLAAPDDAYRVVDVERIMTPALAIYPQLVEQNISADTHLAQHAQGAFSCISWPMC